MKGANMEKGYEVRSVSTEFETREEDNPVIQGYFVRFNDTYNIASDMSESIDRHAFDNTLNGDIRALFNHDTSKVIGRTTNGTLQLNVDDNGLFGTVAINPNDSEAMSIYQKIKRGDVSQCSFGFDIIDQEPITRKDGGTHWVVKEVKLWEVSPCVFPAYESTSISARNKQLENVKREKLEAKKTYLLNKLKGVEDGTKSVDD